MIRRGILLTTTLGALGLCAPAIVRPAPRILWNATASTPIGLYILHPANQLHAMDLVVVQPPASIAYYLAVGHFLPLGVPLLKHVMALPGQLVCRTGDIITVDHAAVGVAQDRDHRGRLLPRWSGCRRLGPAEIFVMNPAVEDSLDGRYFGPFPTSSVVARAVPLWTNDARNGHSMWHIATDRFLPNQHGWRFP